MIPLLLGAQVEIVRIFARFVYTHLGLAMGCGTSNQGGKSAEETERRASQYSQSIKSTTSSVPRLVTVTAARNNRKASCSQGTPKADSVLRSDYADDTSSTSSRSSFSSESGDIGAAGYFRSTGRDARRVMVEEFVFGDVRMDPADVQRQRLERFNRPRQAKPRSAAIDGASEIFDFHDAKVFLGREEYPVSDDGSETPRLKSTRADTLLGHSGRIKTIAVAPNGIEYASSATNDSGASLRKITDGSEVMSFSKGHTLPILACTFNFDGRVLATASRDNSVIIWDVSSAVERSDRKQLSSIEHPCVPVCLAFTCNDRLITGGQDKVSRVWDVSGSGVLIARFKSQQGVVVCLASHPARHFAASGGGDRKIYLWRYEPEQNSSTMLDEEAPFEGPSAEEEADYAFFSHLRSESTSTERCSDDEDDGCVGGMKAMTLPSYAKLDGHEGVIISVTFTREGDRLLSNDDRVCKVWRLCLPEPRFQGEDPSRQIEGKLIQLYSVDLTMPSRGCTVQFNVQLDGLIDQNSELYAHTKPTPIPLDSIPDVVNSRRRAAASFGYAGEINDGYLKDFIGSSNNSIPKSTAAASSIATQKCVFTISCLCPAELGKSFFAVGCTNRTVYIITLDTGVEETSFEARSAVFALSAGRHGDKLLFGDIFGNVYRVTMRG